MRRIMKGSFSVLMVAAVFMLVTSCATTEPAKEEAKPAKKEAAKPAGKKAAEKKAAKPVPTLTPEDVKVEDGELIRTNDPAFTLEIPSGLKPGEPDVAGGQIYTGSQGEIPWTLIVFVYDVPGDLETAAKNAGDGWIAWAKSINSSSYKVISIEPIDTYDEYKAMQVEVEYMHTDGATMLTILSHLIQKGDKIIQMSAWLMGDFSQVTDIFETIDLDPI